MHTVTVLELVEYSIAANHNEVMVGAVDAESSHVGVCNHNSCITSNFCDLSFDVSKSATHREAAWENAMGTQYHLAL